MSDLAPQFLSMQHSNDFSIGLAPNNAPAETSLGGVTTKKPYILGITGRAGAGKDTFAAAFGKGIQDRSKTPKKYSFADPLKEACDVLFGGDGIDHWWSQSGKAAEFPFWKAKLGERYGSGRNILVTVGTDVMRYHVDQKFWLMVAEWRALRTNADVIVIPDVRFDNEAAWIRQMGGDVIQVVNANQKPLRRAGRFVRWLRTVPVIGVSGWLTKLLVLRGYASHASEDGVSLKYVSQTYVSGSAEQTADNGRGFAAIYDLPHADNA